MQTADEHLANLLADEPEMDLETTASMVIDAIAFQRRITPNMPMAEIANRLYQLVVAPPMTPELQARVLELLAERNLL